MNDVPGLFSGDSIDFGVWSCGPKPVGLYVTSSTTLSLSFHICKIGIVIPTFSKGLLGQSNELSYVKKNFKKPSRVSVYHTMELECNSSVT